MYETDSHVNPKSNYPKISCKDVKKFSPAEWKTCVQLRSPGAHTTQVSGTLSCAQHIQWGIRAVLTSHNKHVWVPLEYQTFAETSKFNALTFCGTLT